MQATHSRRLHAITQKAAKVEKPTTDAICASNWVVKACYREYGDYMFVRDGDLDGAAAVGEIRTRHGTLLRVCRNTLGYGKWGRCNFNLVEQDPIKFRGYTEFPGLKRYTDYIYTYA